MAKTRLANERGSRGLAGHMELHGGEHRDHQHPSNRKEPVLMQPINCIRHSSQDER